MNGLLTLVTALATFIVGPFGIAVITIGVACSFLFAALHFCSHRTAFLSLGYGAAAFSAAYFVTLIGGGGG